MFEVLSEVHVPWAALWTKRLSLGEYWYNTNFHTAIKKTPFEIVYGKEPPIARPYLAGYSKVDTVDQSFVSREDMLQSLRANLLKAQNRMKQTQVWENIPSEWLGLS